MPKTRSRTSGTGRCGGTSQRIRSGTTARSALSDEQLDRTAPLALADGAGVSAQQLIEGGVLIEHVRGHLNSIRAAV